MYNTNRRLSILLAVVIAVWTFWMAAYTFVYNTDTANRMTAITFVEFHGTFSTGK